MAEWIPLALGLLGGGQDKPQATTQYQRQPLPNWWQATGWPLASFLQRYFLPGATNWQGPLTAPMSGYETGGLNLYGGAVGSLFGQPNAFSGAGWQPPSPAVPQSPGWTSLPPQPAGAGTPTPGVTPQNWQAMFAPGGGAGVNPFGGGGSATPTNPWSGGWGGATKWTSLGGAPTGGGNWLTNLLSPTPQPARTVSAASQAVSGGGPGETFARIPFAPGVGATGVPSPTTGLGTMQANPLAPGGIFGQSQTALNPYLQSSYLDVANDPYLQAALERSLAQTRHRMGQGGLNWGTSLADAEMRSSADLFLPELARRQALQSGLAQWGTQFPLQALSGFQQAAQAPRQLAQEDINRWVQEFLRQQTLGRGDISNLFNMGQFMAGSPQAVNMQPGQGFGDFLGALLGAAGSAGGFGNLFNFGGGGGGGTAGMLGGAGTDLMTQIALGAMRGM